MALSERRPRSIGAPANTNRIQITSRQRQPSSLLPVALEYASRGWLTFPLHTVSRGRCTCGRSDCSSRGKHPRTARGFCDATTDVEQLSNWWTKLPATNIGLCTGAQSGIFVVDIDLIGALDTLQEEHERLPATLTARTGSGGLHLVFQHPGVEVRNRGRVVPGIDVRGDGGYIVAAPSIHLSGHRYTWINREAPAHAPTWLVDLAKSRPPPKTPSVPPARYTGTDDVGTAWGKAALEGELAELLRAPVGERNHQLFKSACNVFGAAKGGQVATEVARRCLEHAAIEVGLSALETTKTLASAERRAEPRAPEARPA